MKHFTKTFIAINLFFIVACAGPTATLTNPQPPFEWKTANATPGATLQHKEIERRDDIGEVKYKFFAQGVPSDKDYEFWMRWIDGTAGKTSVTIRLKESGELVGYIKDKEANLIITLHDIRESEPVYYALVSRDTAIRAFDTIIPFPVQARSAEGCQLELKLITPDGMNFSIIAKGFEPNEEVTTRSTSNGEVIEGLAQASSSDGVFIAIINPGVVGKRGGTAAYTAVGRSCQVTLNYRWGQAMRLGGMKSEK